jgi:hypothetical protein
MADFVEPIVETVSRDDGSFHTTFSDRVFRRRHTLDVRTEHVREETSSEEAPT